MFGGYPSFQRIPSALAAYYAGAYPAVATARSADIQAAGQALAEIWSRNVFPDLKVTWGTYPNNLGHENAPGCFRCHDGDHATSDGSASIEQDCASCHETIAIDEPHPEFLKTVGL